jgi:hypothetical protein
MDSYAMRLAMAITALIARIFVYEVADDEKS